MSAPTNHWKLGLFVVLGVCAALVTVVFLAAQSLKRDTVAYKTYLDESVQGLELGAPVKFRGVTVGNVSLIDIAADQRHVEVTCEIAVKDLQSLKLDAQEHHSFFGKSQRAKLIIPPDLRMQLNSTGVTGVKFILIDYFDVNDYPVPVLPFPVPPNYVPAAPSTMKNLEDSVVKAAHRLPDIVDQGMLLAAKANVLLDSFSGAQIPERAADTLNGANRVLSRLDGAVKQANVGELSTEAKGALAGMNQAAGRLNAVLAKVDGDRGLIASAQRATDSIGDLAGGAKSTGNELEETLRSVREAVDSVQRLTDALDRDSDMLVKGRAKGKR